MKYILESSILYTTYPKTIWHFSTYSRKVVELQFYSVLWCIYKGYIFRDTLLIIMRQVISWVQFSIFKFVSSIKKICEFVRLTKNSFYFTKNTRMRDLELSYFITFRYLTYVHQLLCCNCTITSHLNTCHSVLHLLRWQKPLLDHVQSYQYILLDWTLLRSCRPPLMWNMIMERV